MNPPGAGVGNLKPIPGPGAGFSAPPVTPTEGAGSLNPPGTGSPPTLGGIPPAPGAPPALTGAYEAFKAFSASFLAISSALSRSFLFLRMVLQNFNTYNSVLIVPSLRICHSNQRGFHTST